MGLSCAPRQFASQRTDSATGVATDVVIDSARVGVTKPDAAIFLAALERLDCSPGEVVFVGDNPIRDMAAAKALGMPHVWLNTLDPDRTPCCENDPVIRSLMALRDILL